MNRDELKERLKEIKIMDFKVPQDMNAFELALPMMEYLGDAEAELRDDLIYSIFSNWITNKVFSKEQLRQMLEVILDDRHLFYKIGEKDTNSVFTRAFSVLVIASLVYMHRQDCFLNKLELMKVKSKVIQYMTEEKDVRGYITDGGWAHTAAHSADALDELALCEELGNVELMELLQAIKDKVCIDDHAFVCYEDERLAYATNSLIGRGLLTEEEISDWIKSFAKLEKSKIYPNFYYLIANIRNYLNSLYYRLPEDNLNVKRVIGETILSIRIF